MPVPEYGYKDMGRMPVSQPMGRWIARTVYTAFTKTTFAN